MTGPLFSVAAFAALNAFSGADRQFWPDLLKDSFNCHDRAQAWYPSRNDPGERMENIGSRLPFGSRAATSAAANFHKSSGFKGSRWRANSSIS
jgi:hypothetical protein